MIQSWWEEPLEIIRKVRSCSYCLKINVRTKTSSTLDCVCHVQEARSTVHIPMNVNGVRLMSTIMKIMATSLSQSVTNVLQEQEEGMIWSAFHAQLDIFLMNRQSSRNAGNAMKSICALLEPSMNSHQKSMSIFWTKLRQPASQSPTIQKEIVLT